MVTARLNILIIPIFIFSILAIVSGCQPNFLKGAGAYEKINPHKDERCFMCHTASIELLSKGSPTEDEIIQRKLMGKDLINLCIECHKQRVKSMHSVGISAKLNRENLPLDQKGNITCAITCHDIHTKDPNLGKKMLRRHFNNLCLSCHDI